MKLRKYQTEAIREVFSYFKTNKEGHPLVVLPTGAGKTHVLAGICETVARKWPKEKILILTHVKEIIEQDYEKLCNYLSKDKVGVYSAGVGLRQRRQFTIAGIQSVYTKPELFQDYRLIIVDEAHLIPTTGEGRYRTFFKGLPNPRVVGLTATPFRLGLGYLTDGDLFTKVVYEADIIRLIREGYLCDLSTKKTKQQMDTRNVDKTGGDYNTKQLVAKLDKESITNSIIKELLQHKETRKHWLVFAIDIKHAEHITQALIDCGITAACLHSEMSVNRGDIVSLFKAGGFQALVSVGMLTTGFDAPNVDLIALLRPTMSPVLHVQMIGRGLRTTPNKKDCLVLDFAGNTDRLGPINKVTVRPAGVKTGSKDAPTKTCPECSEIVGASVRVCPSCGYKFPRINKLTRRASETSVLQERRWIRHKITKVNYTKHNKIGSTPSMRVDYVCGLRVFTEWVTLEHEGFPRHKARHWWKYRANTVPPDTIDEALRRSIELEKPLFIEVQEDGKYPVVKKCIF